MLNQLPVSLFAAVKPGGRLLRTLLKQDASQPDIQILQPINLQVLITRNLAASWYGNLPGVQVQGVLQSVSVRFYPEYLCEQSNPTLSRNAEHGDAKKAPVAFSCTCSAADDRNLSASLKPPTVCR